jgi:hypothetical protein
MRQDLPLELGQARGFGETEHVTLLSIIKDKTAKVRILFPRLEFCRLRE